MRTVPKNKNSRHMLSREFPVSPGVRTGCFHGCGLASVAGGGTESPQATQSNKKNPSNKGKAPPTSIPFLL